jgi:hypothetical protein
MCIITHTMPISYMYPTNKVFSLRATTKVVLVNHKLFLLNLMAFYATKGKLLLHNTSFYELS